LPFALAFYRLLWLGRSLHDFLVVAPFRLAGVPVISEFGELFVEGRNGSLALFQQIVDERALALVESLFFERSFLTSSVRLSSGMAIFHFYGRENKTGKLALPAGDHG
jgi:hypothetical protein